MNHQANRPLLSRRGFLGGALSLPFLPPLAHLAPWLRVPGGSTRSLILLWMDGGMSHLDTFDGKPEAQPDIRGDLKTVPCALEGVFLSEHLPRIARVIDRCALIRSLTSGEGNHDRGSHYMLTGHRPSPVLTYPSLGSWLGQVDPARAGSLPDYVAIPDAPPYGKQGFLPKTRLPFEPGGEPHRPDFRVRDLVAPHERRRALDLLAEVDALDGKPRSAAEQARDRFLEQARRLSDDRAAREVFDLKREKPAVRQRYGRHAFGQSCLLARRLVAAGTRVVLVRYRGWDHHQNIRRAMTYGFPPKLQGIDDGVSALVEDLERSGLGERCAVMLASEFGRTPRLNPRGGRDHWPRAYSVLLYGAGFKRGVVHGATDRRGEEPVEDPVSPADLNATVLTALGVDRETELRTPDGRPIPVVERGAATVAGVLAG